MDFLNWIVFWFIFVASMALALRECAPLWKNRGNKNRAWWLGVFFASLAILSAIAAVWAGLVSDAAFAELSRQVEAANKAAEAAKKLPERMGVIVPGTGLMEPPAGPQIRTAEDFLKASREELEQSAKRSQWAQSSALLATVPKEAQVAVLVGSNVWWSRHLPLTLVRHRGKDFLAIEPDEAGVFISGIFCDNEGEPLCEIRKNRFLKNDDDRFKIDPDSSPTRLTILDRGARILEVVQIEPRRFRVFGNLHFPAGGFCRILGSAVITSEDVFSDTPSTFIVGGSTEVIAGGTVLDL